MMPLLSVRLFGKLCVESRVRVVPNLTARKVQELFCYLLLFRDRPHPRETLAGLFWGEASTTQSRAYLRKALWQLQTTLAHPPACGLGSALLVTSEWVQVNPQADVWLDVAMFEQACAAIQGIAGAQFGSHTAASLQQTVSLYQGVLLEGWYHDWCLYERERLHAMYLALLDKLMDYCEHHHDYESGLAYGTQSLRYDRAREQTHQRMMRLYAFSGDRTAARRQFEHCATALDAELGVQPMPCTLQLYAQIMANQLRSEALPTSHPAPGATTMAPLTVILARLTHLQRTLAELQQCIQHDIHVVEHMVGEQAQQSSLEPKNNALGYTTGTFRDTRPVYALSVEAMTPTANLDVGRPYAELGG